jgi:hypothetical protein
MIVIKSVYKNIPQHQEINDNQGKKAIGIDEEDKTAVLIKYRHSPTSWRRHLPSRERRFSLSHSTYGLLVIRCFSYLHTKKPCAHSGPPFFKPSDLMYCSFSSTPHSISLYLLYFLHIFLFFREKKKRKRKKKSLPFLSSSFIISKKKTSLFSPTYSEIIHLGRSSWP